MYKGKLRLAAGMYMKRSKWIIKQAVLTAVLCLLGQGCTGRAGGSSEQDAWSFQAAQTETVSVEEADPGAAENAPGGSAPSVGTGGSESGAVPETENASAGYVYVCGAVKHPGVYEIHEGMRIFEVLQLAGGMTDEADPDWLNQAQQIADGQKLQIYTKEEAELMRSGGMTDGVMDGLSASMSEGAFGPASDDADAADTSEDKVNINTAGKEELMTLPGIGEAKAEAILRYRQEHGSFGAIEEICQISGIKEAVFSNIKDRITV